MTAQVEFFCSPAEERELLAYLTKGPDTCVYNIVNRYMRFWDDFLADDVPQPPSPLNIYIYQPSHGSIIWHTSRPSAVGPTHSSLVKNLFAGEAWDELKLGSKGKMLDTDLSPIICYCRGTRHQGRTGQNCVSAPPSSLERVGPEYERWVKRSLAWIRRRGTIVHDYRKRSTTLPNPDSILNTIYAFQGVLEAIQSGHHRFMITISDG